MVYYESLSKYDKVTYILQCIMFVEAVIGIFGNVLVVIVFSRKRLRVFSFSFYNRAKAIVDCIILLHSFRHWAAFILDANIDITGLLICKVLEYSAWSTGSISVWLLAVSAFDRFVAIAYPNKFSFMRKTSTQIILTLFVITYCILVHLYMFLNTTLIVTGQNGNLTQLACLIADPSVQKTVYWINMVDQLTGVFLVNNILVFVMIYSIYRSRSRFKQIKENKDNKTSIRDRKFAVNSIVLSVKCLILKSPLYIVSLISAYDLTPDASFMLFMLTVALYTVESMSAFFINMVVNKLFYDEFLSIFYANRVSQLETSNSTHSSLCLFSFLIIHYKNYPIFLP